MKKKNTPITAILLVSAGIVLTMLVSILPMLNYRDEVKTITPSINIKKEKSVEFSLEDVIPSPSFSLNDLLKADVVSNSFSQELPVPDDEDTFAQAPVSNFVYTSEIVAKETTRELAILHNSAPDPNKIGDIKIRENSKSIPQFKFKPPSKNKKLENQEPPPDIIKSQPSEMENISLKEAAKDTSLTDTGISLPLLLLSIIVIAFLAHSIPRIKSKN